MIFANIYFDTYEVDSESDMELLNLFKDTELIKFRFNKFTNQKITDSILNSIKILDNKCFNVS